MNPSLTIQLIDIIVSLNLGAPLPHHFYWWCGDKNGGRSGKNNKIPDQKLQAKLFRQLKADIKNNPVVVAARNHKHAGQI